MSGSLRSGLPAARTECARTNRNLYLGFPPPLVRNGFIEMPDELHKCESFAGVEFHLHLPGISCILRSDCTDSNARSGSVLVCKLEILPSALHFTESETSSCAGNLHVELRASFQGERLIQTHTTHTKRINVLLRYGSRLLLESRFDNNEFPVAHFEEGALHNNLVWIGRPAVVRLAPLLLDLGCHHPLLRISEPCYLFPETGILHETHTNRERLELLENELFKEVLHIIETDTERTEQILRLRNYGGQILVLPCLLEHIVNDRIHALHRRETEAVQILLYRTLLIGNVSCELRKILLCCIRLLHRIFYAALEIFDTCRTTCRIPKECLLHVQPRLACRIGSHQSPVETASFLERLGKRIHRLCCGLLTACLPALRCCRPPFYCGTETCELRLDTFEGTHALFLFRAFLWPL